MEELVSKLKIYIPIILTVISSMTSGIFVAKNYFDSTFVKVGDYKQIKITIAINVLENRKSILENRLYLLALCKATPSCPHGVGIDIEVEKTKRELDDTRNHLEAVRSTRIE